MLKGVAVTIILRTFATSINHSTQSTVIINIKTLKIMKNLNRNEMNAVKGGFWSLSKWIKEQQAKRQKKYDDIWKAAGM